MKVKSESEVAQSCPTLRDPTDCSLPGSSVHGIFQARVLEWGAIAFSENEARGSNSKIVQRVAISKKLLSLAGFWEEVSASHYVDFSIGLLDCPMASLRLSD